MSRNNAAQEEKAPTDATLNTSKGSASSAHSCSCCSSADASCTVEDTPTAATDNAAPLKDVVSHESEAAAAAGTKSIYDLWSPRRRAVTLAVVCISQFLNPISQNAILPGLKQMEAAFGTNATAGAGVLACFVFAVGISSLAWGPFCDLLGRKLTYTTSTAVYAAATVGCIFARNIEMMLAFRTFQGAALGAYRGAGIGSIADVFQPNKRGLAIGILLMSTLVGPVIGPLIGGFLSEAYGWQAPFIALLIFSAGIIIPANILLVRETHQYKVMKRLDPSTAATIREGPTILAHPPKCGSPWAPLVSVCDKRLVLHLLHASVGFACMMSSQAELTGVLTAAPYNFSPGIIGVTFIVSGAAGIVASPLGGRLFDRAARTTPHPMVRLLQNNLASLIGLPAGLLLYGWASQLKAHAALVLLGLFTLDFAMCLYFPAFMSYLSIVKQQAAATASSGQNAIIFVISGVLVLAGSAITTALGLGWYMTMLAAIHLVVAVLALWQILCVRTQQRQHLPVREAVDAIQDLSKSTTS